MDKLKGNEIITQFNANKNDYFMVITKEGSNITKNIYDSKMNKVNETPSMIKSQIANGTILKEKEKKSFIKNFNKAIKHKEKMEEIEIKKDVKRDEYKNMNEEQLEKMFTENGIKEGNIYSVNVSNKNNSENSVAYFEVYRSQKDNMLRLRPYTKDPSFKSNGNSSIKANAELLTGASALALISDDFAEKKIYAAFKNNNKDKVFQTEKLKILRTDITRLAEKSIKNNKVGKNKVIKEEFQTTEEKQDFNVQITNIPSNIEKKYKEKGMAINPEIYTKKMFEMFRNISEIPEEDRNINSLEKRIFGPLLKKLVLNQNDINEQEKIFSQWVFDNNGKTPMNNAGYLFEKSLNEKFKGFKIQRNSFDEKERDENVEAILNNSLPIMNDHKNIDYIYDPETRSLYKGNTQMSLHRNNELHEYYTDTYVTADNMIRNSSDTIKKGMKVKYEVAELGTDSNGRKHFAVLVPCKPSWSEKRALKQENKKAEELRKEEYRRNKFDAKYLYKHGELPEYRTALQPLPTKQPSLAVPGEIKNPYPKPEKDSSVQDKLNYEFANYFKSMFTKEPFIRGTDWLKKENKKDLLEFAKSKPELFRSMYDACYNLISVQVKQANRNNKDVNQIIKYVTDEKERNEVNENLNKNTQKRVRK